MAISIKEFLEIWLTGVPGMVWLLETFLHSWASINQNLTAINVNRSQLFKI
jgi:hypothetical protein